MQEKTRLVFLLAAASACLVAPFQAAAFNRCVIDGRTVYQDAPCPGAQLDAEVQRRKEERQAAETAAREKAAREAQDRKLLSRCGGVDFQERVDTYLRAHPKLKAGVDSALGNGPYVGMPEEMLKAIFCDFIETVNETESRFGVRRQYVMNSASLSRYVYTENGLVTTVQR